MFYFCHIETITFCTFDRRSEFHEAVASKLPTEEESMSNSLVTIL